MSYVSSGDDDTLATTMSKNAAAKSKKSTASQSQPPKKRQRADTTLSDTQIPDHLRIVVNRQNTPFEPSSPEEDSPICSESQCTRSIAASEASTTSEAESTTTSVFGFKEAERKECLARIKCSKRLDVYAEFEEPQLIEIPGQRSTHYGFKCKHCNEIVPRPIDVMETTNLKNHASNCAAARKQAQDLLTMGITSLTILTPEFVRELFALWFVQHSRPFVMVEDEYQIDLLHPDARKHKPSRVTISKDIQRLYKARQQHVINLFAAHKGVFHIALDLCQGANGFDYLGIVVFWASAASGKMKIERLVVECLNFEGSHTGLALTKTVLKVLKKFRIEDRVWGVVADNASNNDSMVNLLATHDLKQMKGADSSVHCTAHVMNLVAQDILAFLRRKRGEVSINNDGDDDDDEEGPATDTDCDAEDPDKDVEDNGQGLSVMLNGEDEEEEEEEPQPEEELNSVNVPPIESSSPEEKQYIRATAAYWKLAKVAHKLQYCPAAKKLFRLLCVKKAVERPYNVRRNMITRWGSSNRMFGDSVRVFDAIIAFQSNRRYTPVSHTFRLGDYDILQHPLATVTEILSRGGIPSIAEVIVHFDCLTQEYTDIALDKDLPLWVRHCALLAIQKLNKYYDKTDNSVIYRIAMLIHPSIRVQYMKNTGWPEDWIKHAVELLVKEWKAHYKLKASNRETAPQSSQFGYSLHLQRMYANGGNSTRSSTCPVTEFVNSPPVLEPPRNGQPVLFNPLVWWYGQQTIGNKWDGLTQLAIDVLLCPTTSVNVEQAFSLLSIIVSKRHHSLSAQTIQSSATLSSYAKASLVKRGVLTQILRGERSKKKAAKAKS